MPSADDDYRLARKALLAGDHAHAAKHIAGALSTDPLRRDWLLCLDQIVADAAEPADLIPQTRGMWFGEAAVRARILWICGKKDEALGLIVQVAGVAPEARYLAWAAEWAAHRASQIDLEFALRLAHTLAGFLAALIKLPIPLPADHPIRESTSDALEFLDELARAHPAPAIWGLRSQLLRRLGRFDDAIAAASDARESAPSRNSEVHLALALRDGGRPAEALDAYRRALVHEPGDASVHLDMGDLLLDQRRWDEAAAHYREARALDPGNEWAEPSLLYAGLRAGSLEGRARLEKLAPRNPRAAWALRELEPKMPYINWLPRPDDAIVNGVRAMLAKSPPNPIVRSASSSLEAPSAILAARVAQGAPFEIEFSSIPEPDARRPSRPVQWLLWRYEGNTAIPNLPPPPSPVLSEVETLANTAFRIAEWISGGPPRAAIEELLGSMVHPPPPPSRSGAPEWIFRAQIASACLVARADWRVLLDVLAGPMDWTVGAAAIVLAQVAQRESTEEIGAAFEARLRSAPRNGYCPYLHPLVCAWLRLPGLADAQREKLERWKRSLEDLTEPEG